MSLQDDINAGKYLLSGGANITCSYGFQNLHSGTSPDAMPIPFYMRTEALPTLIFGMNYNSDTVNTMLAFSAIKEPNGEIAMRTDTQGAPLVFTNGSSPVDASGASILNANPARRYVCIVNTSTAGQKISLNFDAVAVDGSGIVIYPQGSYEISSTGGNLNLGKIYAIANAAGGSVAICEGV